MMSLALEIFRILLPIIIVGAIVVFIVLRMVKKGKNGTLGKKDSEGAQILLDSLIPLGMISGCAVAVLVSMFFPVSFLTAVSFGPGIGMLFGYIAYEIYSKREESY